jgi:hypothetical protein
MTTFIDPEQRRGSLVKMLGLGMPWRQISLRYMNTLTGLTGNGRRGRHGQFGADL